jgi:hypothetical protein
MSSSQTVPADRVRIFKRDGTPIAEFRANVSRSHVIGAEGRARFEYPARKTQIVNEDVLQHGNWLLVQNSVLPPWVGVLDAPREWSTRNVTVSAYTTERVFTWRIGPLEEVVTGSPGVIFMDLIRRVNLAEQTVIRSGSIWGGGAQKQITLNPVLLSESLSSLREDSGEEYYFYPQISDNGKLIVAGNWVQFLGAETGVLLHEGIGGGNVEAVGKILTEDGPIVNSLLAYGDGETWRSKPSAEVTSADSIAKYGLRESAQEYQGVTSATILQASGAQYLAEFRNPARSFTLNALNVGDTFKYIKLGNIFNVQFQSAGFRGGSVGYASRVRVVGMSYNPTMKNKIQLVAREVI